MIDKGRSAGTQRDIDKAIALHRGGHLDNAARLYEAVLAADPSHGDALHFLGVLHHQRGQSDAAVASIEQAIRLAPDYADAHNNLGNVLKELGRLEPAFRAYRRVVELVPGHADAWNNLGVVLRGRGLYDEAEQAYAQAIAANPTHAAAWQNRGNLLARLRRFDEAAAAYTRVLELRPRNTAAYDALGRTYDELVEAELSVWLAGQQPVYDLIVSADTLCYFGALDTVCAAAATALRPGGRLVFTVERAPDGVEAYQLDPSGRYSHAGHYVRDRLAGAALDRIAIEPVVLRREVGHEVHGLLVSAERPI